MECHYSSPNDINSSPSKRTKLSHHQHQNDNNNNNIAEDELIPGLPNELAEFCLSHVNPSTLYHVSRAWRKILYAPTFPPFHALYALLSQDNTLHLHSFDPIAGQWAPVPPPPTLGPHSILLRHPSFMSRRLPVQSLSVSNRRLLLLAATSPSLSPALASPLSFDPLNPNPNSHWSHFTPLPAPRRWCAAGSLRGSPYVASGFGSHFSPEVARSVERLVGPTPGARWERVADLRDGRFSREAIEAVGWRGRLCMVNVKGGAPKDGAVFDADRDEWAEMPRGMLAGWRGPAAAMDEDQIFVVDETAGVLRRYVEAEDRWDDVARSERIRGAEHMAAGGGRVCIVCSGGRGILVVDVAGEVGRMWEVETPPGLETMAVHILPRMSISS